MERGDILHGASQLSCNTGVLMMSEKRKRHPFLCDQCSVRELMVASLLIAHE